MAEERKNLAIGKAVEDWKRRNPGKGEPDLFKDVMPLVPGILEKENA